jgi:heterodisulfide reductase subunit A-like polyferredoxin
VATQPELVDVDRCDACGACVPACGRKAISMASDPRSVGRAVIDSELCQRHEGCHLCADACPKEAIDLALDEGSEMLEAEAIIVAIGAEPFDPASDPRLGHGVV